MNTDWDGAPSRAQRKSQFLGMAISTALAVCLLTGLAYVIQSSNALTFKQTAKQQAQMRQNYMRHGHEAAQDVQSSRRQHEQDNYHFRSSPEQRQSTIQRAAHGVEVAGQQVRQRVFNDDNYTPRHDINIISMGVARPPVESRQISSSRAYVTVVEETRLSCWPFSAGSAECRTHKQRVLQQHLDACALLGNSSSCQIANKYDLR